MDIQKYIIEKAPDDYAGHETYRKCLLNSYNYFNGMSEEGLRNHRRNMGNYDSSHSMTADFMIIYELLKEMGVKPDRKYDR